MTENKLVHLCTLMTASQEWIKCGKTITVLLNLGSSEMVSINQLIDMIEKIEIKVERKYDLTKPQGVRGRNSDNTLIKEITGWVLSCWIAGRFRKNICLDL